MPTSISTGARMNSHEASRNAPERRLELQSALSSEEFGRFATWASLNRGDLTIFAHANTGDDLADHTRHVVWFGPSETLKLSIFR